MLQKSRELIYSVVAILVVTMGYLLVQNVFQEVPSASSFWGHSIGILGFIMMIMTETLYSLRKRSRRAQWGKMAGWLQFHIFTGIVGPYMVLIHPGWQFKGLAGVLSLLTVLIVISGFVGRYIYTVIPRTVDGAEVDPLELESRLARLKNALGTFSGGNEQTLAPAGYAGVNSAQVEAELPFTLQDLSPQEIKEFKRSRAKLQKEYDNLNRIISNRRQARQLFSLWHTIHIPLGLTLFSIAFVHIGAAIYYAMLLN